MPSCKLPGDGMASHHHPNCDSVLQTSGESHHTLPNNRAGSTAHKPPAGFRWVFPSPYLLKVILRPEAFAHRKAHIALYPKLLFSIFFSNLSPNQCPLSPKSDFHNELITQQESHDSAICRQLSLEKVEAKTDWTLGL